MLPKLQENSKLKKELKKFERHISKIQNIHARNSAESLLQDLKNEYLIIDESYSGTNGPVTPITARESVMKSIDLRRKLSSLLKC